MRIAYVFPSRERPDKFFNALDNIKIFSETDNYFVWAKLDNDDPQKENYEKRLHEYPEVTVKWGLSKNKVHAINRDVEDIPPFDIGIIMSDDIKWISVGFDEEIRSAFKKYFPDLDGTIHFHEKHAADRTIIVSIIGSVLYQQLGYLYWPEYHSVYCDNDFTEMTRMMKKYAYIKQPIFMHLHPIWNLCAWDAQYRRTESAENYKHDKEVLDKRRADKFGLK